MKQSVVSPTEDRMRLDMVLVARFKMSRQAVKRCLDAGLVRLNGKTVVIAKWVVRTGDRLTMEEAGATPAVRERRAGRRQVSVLYEDAVLIAVDKPAGMIVVPEAATTAPTVVDAVRAYLRRKYPGSRGTYARALHRLDRGTSGVVLLAKSRAGEVVIQQFKRHTVQREYLAVVHGAVGRQAATLRIPLAKGRFGHGRKVAAVGGHPEPEARDLPGLRGKPAITHFNVEERYSDATLLKIKVETGRTHQIRVHLAAIGHPLMGDELYGHPVRGSRFEVRDSKSSNIEHGTSNRKPIQLPSGRQALHATRLKLRHPLSGDVVDVHAKIPPDLERLIDSLRG